MPSSRELLNDPKFQRMLVDNGERLFDLDQVFAQPTVIFDRGGADEFWTTTSNSREKKQHFDKIRRGEVVPINADGLGDIAQVHTMFHTYLSECGINTIPTFVNITGEVALIGRHQLPEIIPGVYVRKTSFKDGRSTSHRGEGVSIVHVTDGNIDQAVPKNLWEFLQPFVLPPNEYVRDIRVYVVGGDPVAGVVRRARKPLLPQNLTGEVLPTTQQYPSAQAPGPNEPLTGRLKEQVFDLTDKISDILDAKIRSRARPFSPYTTFGFGSVDFLLDASGTPLPVDFDVSPSSTTFENINEEVGQAMALFLEELATLGDTHRKILLIGDIKEDDLVGEVFKRLTADNVTLQSPIVRKLFREISTEPQPKRQMPISRGIKVGRNENCPCGSGHKYKKCHGR